MKKENSFISKWITFFTHDLWVLKIGDLPPKKSFGIKLLRVFTLSIRSFLEDHCSLRASALTFYSILSIVPLMALFFGVAQTFNAEAMLRDWLLDEFRYQREVVIQVMTFSERMLNTTQGGVIAGVGVLFLLFSVIKLLSNIEASLNHIWCVKQGRPFLRKATDYLSVMIICPILLIVASSASIFLSSKLATLPYAQDIIGPVGQFFMSFLPWVMVWLVFTFIYRFLPYLKISLFSAFIGGLIAGTMFQLFQMGYIYFQVSLASYNAIYGSFAALPLFLLWLQISWLILLFGAEVSFAHQNIDTYELEPLASKLSTKGIELYSLYIIHFLVKRFEKGEGPISATHISKKLDLPIRLVRDVLRHGIQANLIVKSFIGETTNQGYLLAVSPETLSLTMVREKLNGVGIDHLPITGHQEIEMIKQKLAELEHETKTKDCLIKNI